MSIVLSNPEREDGFGSQYQTIIYTVMMAELKKLRFVYSPFDKMEHNYDNDPEFIQKKEKMINFIGNFDMIGDIDDKSKFAHKPQVIRYHATEIVKFFEHNITKCMKTNALKKIKELYFANNKRVIENKYVAIHIRRPNEHDNRIQGTDVSNEFYIKVLDFIKNEYPEHEIHIYSQGLLENFNSIIQYIVNDCSEICDKIFIHLNDRVEVAFNNFVQADVLVIAPSSYSYTAGLISNNTVYYIPFWHSYIPFWIRL